MMIRLLSLLLLFSLSLYSQELPPRTITVIGAAEQSLIANKATFMFAVLGLGSSLRAAVEDAKTKTDKIATALTRIGVPRTAFATEEFLSSENWDKAFLSSSRDYQATVRTTVTIDSLELLESAVLSLSDHKPESISSISFQLSDLEQRRREVQIAAVEDAKTQANRIMDRLGVAIKEPYLVETYKEEAPVRPFMVSQMNVRGARSGEMSYESGPSSLLGAKKIVVKEMVRVVFSF